MYPWSPCMVLLFCKTEIHWQLFECKYMRDLFLQIAFHQRQFSLLCLFCILCVCSTALWGRRTSAGHWRLPGNGTSRQHQQTERRAVWVAWQRALHSDVCAVPSDQRSTSHHLHYSWWWSGGMSWWILSKYSVVHCPYLKHIIIHIGSGVPIAWLRIVRYVASCVWLNSIFRMF